MASVPQRASPLRGLGSFVESERDIFRGRDRERQELASLVTSEGFRAGLFYGEAGTGKTSLLRAGLQADLQSQGVVALYCTDNSSPLVSFAHALAELTGHSAKEGEKLTDFMSRVIADSKQTYIFLLDDIDLVMSNDDRIAIALAELFTRVVTRSAGRARFLFTCVSDRVHSFAALEKRTGSLFPPTSRYELTRMQVEEARAVLHDILALAGTQGYEELAPSIIAELAQDGLILPADLQIAALALRGQNIATAEELARLGGYQELERRWIRNAARATGNERAAMRVLAQLAGGQPGRACLATWAAARASVEPSFARDALLVLQNHGLVLAFPVPGSDEQQYCLAHEVLASRVREQAAPARLSAQHAADSLGSKAAQDKALSPLEYLEIRREGIVAATPQEQAILERTQRLGKLALAAVAAVPLVIVVIAYSMMSGNYYLDTAYSKEGIETIVVRAGRPSMSWFNWLPKSPSFGSVVADTGLTQRMVSDKQWRQARDNELSGDLEGDGYATQARAALTPQLSHLVKYAQSGDASSLKELHALVKDEGDFARLLHSLRPIAKGSPEEVLLVASALTDPSAAVQTEALMLAAAVTARDSASYTDILTKSLASPDAEHRRLCFSVVRTLKPAIAAPLYQAASDLSTDPAATRELSARLAGGSNASASSAAGILLGEEVSDTARAKAHRILRRAFEADPKSASSDAGSLLANEAAAVQDRLFAIDLLLDYATGESLPSLQPAAEQALASPKPRVKAAALALSARINPGQAAQDLPALTAQLDTLAPAMQIAVARAWGQVAKVNPDNRDAAKSALDKMLKSENRGLRGAAARAYGYVGRSSQAELAQMITVEFLDVAENAAYGLANSAEIGASVINAIAGIRDMWKRKGKLRRISAEVFARLARWSPQPAYFYISASARATDDTSLHAIGMRGLCNALRAGKKDVGKDLARAAKSTQVEVRRIAIECVVDFAKVPAVSVQVAKAMASDENSEIRLESARVLASLASAEAHREAIAPALSAMVSDPSRTVRTVAIRALTKLGNEVPPEALQALPGVFEEGDEAEKLAILETAAQVGDTELVQRGIADASPLVRIAALDTSIATKSDVSAILNAALTDSESGVRRAALARLSEGKHGLPASDVTQALALAARDKNPAMSDLAMMTNARVGDPTIVSEQLARALQSRSEAIRAKAATASLGLVSHAPKAAIELLTPLLNDPSHDVRVAMLPALADAYAATMNAAELGKLMRKSEARANRRVVVLAAFLSKASLESDRASVVEQLEAIATSGPALAKQDAALALALLSESADGLAFLRLLVP